MQKRRDLLDDQPDDAEPFEVEPLGRPPENDERPEDADADLHVLAMDLDRSVRDRRRFDAHPRCCRHDVSRTLLLIEVEGDDVSVDEVAHVTEQ
jgi:hypothetical protein